MPRGAGRKATALPATEIAHLRDLLPLFGLDQGRPQRRAKDQTARTTA
jgi:hypothetical protein